MSRAVVLVSAYYPPHIGGQEIIVQQLATRLHMTGEEVQVVTSSLGAIPGVTIEAGVRVSRLKSAEAGHTAVIWGLFAWLLRRTGRRTVVHVHVGQAFTPEMVWLASRLRRFKYIMHMHIDPTPSGSAGRLLPLYKKVFLKRALRSAAAVAVLNDSHSRLIRDHYGYTGRVVVMSNGIEEDFFGIRAQPSSPETGLALVFVGRLSPQKNLTTLLEAIELAGQELTLDIIGDGECRGELESLIRSRNLTNVHLHGSLDREEIREFYATRSALILPSLYEAQPVVLLEAMASEIPVIATAVVGINEVAAGRAILVEPTREGIAEGIRAFAKMTPDERDAMVQAAASAARERLWPNVIRSYVALYDEVGLTSSTP